MARLALILNTQRPVCVGAALLGTGNRMLFAFSLAGGGHTHLRQAAGSPVLIKGLWLRPDCSMWQGLRAGKAMASCAVHSPKICLYLCLGRSFC